MDIKDRLKKILFDSQFQKAITRLSRSSTNRKTIKMLGHTPYLQGMKLKKAMEQSKRKLPKLEHNFITKIEDERNRLLSRSELLIDGTLGEGGLYDKGVTIKRVCKASKPPRPSLILYLMTRSLKPQNVIELGTNVGISSSYIGAAQKFNSGNGKLTTLDASPYRQRLAKDIHCNLGIDNITYVEGLFTDTLSATLGNMGPIDLAFIDGHHKYQPTLDYYEEILQFATTDAVFVFDDIRYSDGMKRAWSQIQSDERIGLILDFSTVGICVRRQATFSKRYVFQAII